jgi:hypothetical protein
VSQSEKDSVFRNYKGEIYRYPEPLERSCDVPYDDVWYRDVEVTKSPLKRALRVVTG